MSQNAVRALRKQGYEGELVKTPAHQPLRLAYSCKLVGWVERSDTQQMRQRCIKYLPVLRTGCWVSLCSTQPTSPINFVDLVIVSIVLVFGIGNMALSFGDFSLHGVSLCAITAVLLNLILPHEDKEDRYQSTEVTGN